MFALKVDANEFLDEGGGGGVFIIELSESRISLSTESVMVVENKMVCLIWEMILLSSSASSMTRISMCRLRLRWRCACGR